ncbi:diadenylate cyclase CdaA [Polyangium mundeleinium]|uniref:Diadenylate cyclase n=1 Tax=Polyangium mundeleinium TaxID=2995306 RepID=A0ABT5EH25_9BACT|nr:diadenylate cyclase CdaA [Polyangium mundeleinium]MDC0740051.1 diadenylate cyclase CdaA [Polyangium mundeleinium]
MLDGLLRLFAPRPFLQILRDFIDIFIVAYVIYRALLVMRGTRAMQMGLGLGIVFLLYLAAKTFELVTLLHLLSWLLSSIILIVVVVFQNDIRRALIRMGSKAWLAGGREQQSRVIDEVVAAATELARHRMGAIIAFEQDANVLEFCKSEGIVLDSIVTRELLVSMFVPESVNKLHDGAVLIRDLKIARAGVFFPMPETKVLDASLGSRHRAALGITEETDAVVVVVSEERGTISFCFSGNIVSNLDGQSLRHALLGLFGRSSRKKQKAAAARKPPAPPTQAPPQPSRTPAIPPPAPPVRPSIPTPPSVGATPMPGASGAPASRMPQSSAAMPMRPATTTEMPPASVAAPTLRPNTFVPTSTVPPPPPSSDPAPPAAAAATMPPPGVVPAAPQATTPPSTPPSTPPGPPSSAPPGTQPTTARAGAGGGEGAGSPTHGDDS